MQEARMVIQTIQKSPYASQLGKALLSLVAMTALGALAPAASRAEQTIAWTEDYEAAVQRAAATNGVLLLHFYGDYCPPCKLLDKKTFRDPTLVNLVNENVIPVKINADKRHDLAKEYNVTRWPTDVYIGQGGDELYRGISDQDPTVYGTKIKRIMLVHRDRTLERQAIAQQTQRRHEQRLAATSPQIQSERPVYAGNAGHAVKTQAAQWVPQVGSTASSPSNATPVANATPAPAAAPVFVASKPARVIDNPYLQQQPLQVPAADPTTLPATTSSLTTQPSVHPNVAPDRSKSSDSGTYTSAQVSNSRTVGHLVSSINGRNQESVPGNEANNTNAVTPTPPASVPPTIGLEGYCPVALIDSLNKTDVPAWVTGSPSYAVKHRGRIYHCSSEPARQLLLTNPDLYTPSLSCCDLVHFFKTQELVDGKCQFGCIQPKTNRVFLFTNQDNYREFEAKIEQYSQLLDNATQERVATLPDDHRVR
jgi:thiol-disulfide isomerase/thioredoxin